MEAQNHRFSGSSWSCSFPVKGCCALKVPTAASLAWLARSMWCGAVSAKTESRAKGLLKILFARGKTRKQYTSITYQPAIFQTKETGSGPSQSGRKANHCGNSTYRMQNVLSDEFHFVLISKAFVIAPQRTINLRHTLERSDLNWLMAAPFPQVRSLKFSQRDSISQKCASRNSRAATRPTVLLSTGLGDTNGSFRRRKHFTNKKQSQHRKNR